MTSRRLLTTIGATALGFGVVVGGTAAALPNAFAQESTPATEVSVPAEREIDVDALRAEAYDSLVATLASELGVDPAAVDTAIRTALKQQVDERETAGDLSAEQAAAMRAVIDVTEAPLGFGPGGRAGFGGPGGMRGFGGRGGGIMDHDEKRLGPRGGFEVRPEMPGSVTPPALLPRDDDASDQSAPESVLPTDSASDDTI